MLKGYKLHANIYHIYQVKKVLAFLPFLILFMCKF